MSRIVFPPGTLLNPVPAVLVSCGQGDVKNLITVAWTGIVNSDPPITYISVRKSRRSHEIIRQTGEFVINLTTADLAETVDFCGVRSGRDGDKFELRRLTPLPSQKVGCPSVAQSPVSLECKVTEIKEFPTHDMFLAEILCVTADEKLMDRKGKLRLERAGLLCYSHGEYFSVAENPLGRFGFSVMKPKTKKRIRKEKMKR